MSTKRLELKIQIEKPEIESILEYSDNIKEKTLYVKTGSESLRELSELEFVSFALIAEPSEKYTSKPFAIGVVSKARVVPNARQQKQIILNHEMLAREKLVFRENPAYSQYTLLFTSRKNLAEVLGRKYGVALPYDTHA